MPSERISKTTINRLTPADKPFLIYDTDLRGFAVRVMPSGTATFVAEYRPGSGGRNVSKRRVNIGRVGTLTPDEARKLAKTMLADVARGHDPAAVRRRSRETPKFGSFADDMLRDAEVMAKAHPGEALLRVRSIENYRSLLKKHVRPALGAKKLDDISRQDVSRLHARVGQTSPAVANRILEFIGRTYRAAAEAKLIDEGTNPARGIKAFKETKRERFLTADEVQRLGAAIIEGETLGLPWDVDPSKLTKHLPTNQRTIIDPDATAALRLLIFTGARLREVLHAKWEDVDVERGVLIVHGKTGRRPVILPAPAAAIFAGLTRRCVYVFPGANSTPEKPAPRADLNKPWRAVAKRAELDGVRLHDLRHSFASFAAAGGASLPIIGKLLGHSQPQTTARYSHLADNPLRAVADRVGDTVAAALGGAPVAEVVKLPRRTQKSAASSVR